MVTRSGSESAFILRMTWPLWLCGDLTDAELAADLLVPLLTEVSGRSVDKQQEAETKGGEQAGEVRTVA
jgi:hypothetical protein